jgi:hypothetical protein
MIAVSRRASKSAPAQASRIALSSSLRRMAGGSSGTIGGVIRSIGVDRGVDRQPGCANARVGYD